MKRTKIKKPFEVAVFWLGKHPLGRYATRKAAEKRRDRYNVFCPRDSERRAEVCDLRIDSSAFYGDNS